ncbi:hypothetical protein MPNT_310007 [Candidatus Methylacidithermus pantelleriae]|uniref:Uncharacterized protein n=1 Tax=Candidatus Methylacidithermus pantelleriae TaxID=2744239 RepID=A0A8J2FP27_9BACT|nr:hypothetical protein MPNT_310007 [Candidatus Methylacidithermus pantelleriae]
MAGWPGRLFSGIAPEASHPRGENGWCWNRRPALGSGLQGLLGYPVDLSKEEAYGDWETGENGQSDCAFF